MRSTRAVATVSLLAIGLIPAAGAVAAAATTQAPAKIAFVKRSDYELWTANVDGRGHKRMSSGNEGLADFAWSPDGRRIAFIGSGRLQVVDADGSHLRRLTESTVAIGLTWSPDGRRIAYAGFDRGTPGLNVVSAAGGTPRKLATGVDGAVSPSWSPRGGTIAFASSRIDDGSIYTIGADGKGLRKLTDGADDSHPSWSPDGRQLLFQRNSCSPGGCGYRIHVIRPPTTNPRRLIAVPRDLGEGPFSIAWSADSRRLAFARSREGLLSDEVVVMDADGRNLRVLTKDRVGGYEPAWSPDGRRIAYEAQASIYVVNSDGSGKRLLVKFARLPAWQPRA